MKKLIRSTFGSRLRAGAGTARPSSDDRHEHDPHPVADDLEDEAARVVLRQRLAVVDGGRNLEGELAGAIGHEGQLRLGPLAASADAHDLLCDDLALPLEHQRDVGRGEAARADRHVHRDLVADEGEVVDHDLVDGEVLSACAPTAA